MDEGDIYWKQKTSKLMLNEAKSTHADYSKNLIMCRNFIEKITPNLVGNMRIYLFPDPKLNISLSTLNISLLMISSKDTRPNTIGFVFCDHLDLNEAHSTFSRKLEHVFNQHMTMAKRFVVDKK